MAELENSQNPDPLTSNPAGQGMGHFLLAASVLYTGLPYLCFVLGWLQWWAALLAVVLLGVLLEGMIGLARRAGPEATLLSARSHEFLKKSSFWAKVFVWAGASLVLVSLSGAGGLGVQEGDYFKHNAVLKHLIDEPWPVWLQTDRGRFPLVYYPAWYLPAAVVGKWAGWTAAQGVLFFWTLLGVWLSLAWFVVLVGRCRGMVLFLFFFFSAPDVVGAALFKLLGWDPGPPRPPPVPSAWGIDWYALRWWNWELRWWAGPSTWNYCSQMELLFWVPQQALGAWLTTGMAMFGYFHGSSFPGTGSQGDWRGWALAPLALSALWSPLVTVGLVPFLGAEMLARWRRSGLRFSGQGVWDFFRPWASGPNLAALGLLVLMGLYYGAHFLPIPFTNTPLAEFRFFGFEDWPLGKYLFRLVCFWLVDVGSIVGLILILRRPRPGRERILFGVAIGVLLGLALFRYGLNNDLGMRVSMPWLFVLGVFLAKGAVQENLSRLQRWILFGALVLMVATPAAEVYRHLREIRRQGQWIAVPPATEVQSLWELNHQYRIWYGHDFFIRQYVGSPEAAFFRYLAAPSGEKFPPGQE